MYITTINSSINEQALSLSILPPTPNTTIKETVSTQNETAKATPGSQKRTHLLSDKMFDKDLCLWCLGPDENIKKKKTNCRPFYRLEQKKSWRHICACTPF